MRDRSEYVQQFYKDNKLNFAMSILICILAAIFNIANAFLLQQLIDVAVNGTMDKLKIVILKYVIFMFMFLVICLLKRYFMNNYVEKAMKQYKDYAFNNLLKKNINTFGGNITSKYISIFTNDLNVIETGYVRSATSIFSQSLQFVLAIAAMAYMSFSLMVIVVVASILSIVVSFLFGNSLSKMDQEVSKVNEKFIATVKDMLTGFNVIKSFKVEKEVFTQFKSSNSELENSKKRKNKKAQLIEVILGEAGIALALVTYGMGAYFSIKGFITAGTVVAFIQLLNFVIEPINQLGNLIPARKSSKGLIEKMEKATYFDDNEENKIYINEFSNAISFNNVSFGYEQGIDILKNINIKFEKGKSYVLVGASGSGKSTILNLILGYMDNYRGEILFDNVELRKIKTSSLYELFSVIQQNVFIFDNTIRENIVMFKEYNDKEVNKAVDSASLTNLISEKGYNYVCGEGGKFLSGGEKQRISIARSLIKKSPILIMDEGTSALDVATSQSIEEELAKIKGLTKIVITHKMDKNILSMYDEIIVLNNGTIYEKGSFDELISKEGYFYSLYNLTNMVQHSTVETESCTI
ncbi:ABC transporter ATP-binding protein [Clostridium butanoliproducens]|uniref:ABC transporter ATP-binding protein n=1 Tax=Clostridium butanoliproducens TaxID=2991837 RepID=UPI0024B935F0|nr:ABC transporter ATP-binding protein [Clostridium butanoliproducens]MDU1350557.1 ABC transporter ATP-binding protein [Clostridium argentinense]